MRGIAGRSVAGAAAVANASGMRPRWPAGRCYCGVLPYTASAAAAAHLHDRAGHRLQPALYGILLTASGLGSSALMPGSMDPWATGVAFNGGHGFLDVFLRDTLLHMSLTAKGPYKVAASLAANLRAIPAGSAPLSLAEEASAPGGGFSMPLLGCALLCEPRLAAGPKKPAGSSAGECAKAAPAGRRDGRARSLRARPASHRGEGQVGLKRKGKRGAGCPLGWQAHQRDRG